MKRLLSHRSPTGADVDDVEEPPLRTRQEQGMNAFSQPEEALNPRQRVVVRQDDRGWRNSRLDRVGARAKQQHAGGNRAILVARERRDAQHFDDRRDPVGARGAGIHRVGPRVQERANVAVLDRAAEQVQALRDDSRVLNGPITRRQHRANRLRQPHFMGRERPEGRHAQRIARSEPPDDQCRRIGRRLDRQPAISRSRRRRFGVEGRPLEKLAERGLQQAVV